MGVLPPHQFICADRLCELAIEHGRSAQIVDLRYTMGVEAVIVRECMGNPRYQPRRYTHEPAGFGKVEGIQWKPVEAGAEDQHRAAQLQHAWAVRFGERPRGSTAALPGMPMLWDSATTA